MWDGGIGNRNISTGTEKYDSCRNQGGKGRGEYYHHLKNMTHTEGGGGGGGRIGYISN